MSKQVCDEIRDLISKVLDDLQWNTDTYRSPTLLQMIRAVDFFRMMLTPPEKISLGSKLDHMFTLSMNPLIRMTLRYGKWSQLDPKPGLVQAEIDCHVQVARQLGNAVTAWMATDLVVDGIYRARKVGEGNYLLTPKEGLSPLEVAEAIQSTLEFEPNYPGFTRHFVDPDFLVSIYANEILRNATETDYCGHRPSHPNLAVSSPYYHQMSISRLSHYHGFSEFLPEHRFGPIAFDDICKMIVALHAICCRQVGLHLAHSEVSSELAEAGSFTFVRSKTEILSELTDFEDIDPAKASYCLDLLSEPTGKQSAEAIMTKWAPPVIKTPENDYILSFAILDSSSISYALGKLHTVHKRDFDRGIDEREERFIQGFSSLFGRDRFLLRRKPFKIRKDKRILTDIDFAILDLQSGSLALIQLKWQSAFGYSMRERRSKINNFTSTVSKWTKVVEKWAKTGNAQQRLSKLFPNGSMPSDLKIQPLMFGIGRYFSRGSNLAQPPASLACGTWAKFRSLWREYCLESDPLRIIHNQLPTVANIGLKTRTFQLSSTQATLKVESLVGVLQDS